MKEFMLVGTVLKPQGVRGEAKVKSFARNLEDFLRWKMLYLKQGQDFVGRACKCSRVQDGFAYVTLEGCASVEDVERLRNQELYIDRAHAAPLEDGAVYICDLVGCRALDEQDREIGVLTDVLQHGPVDVYVFKTSKGTMMAPALKTVFTEVDTAAGIIRVDAERLAEVAVFED